MAFISQQTHNEVQDLGKVTHWHLPPRDPDFWFPQSRKKAGEKQEKSRTIYGCSCVTRNALEIHLTVDHLTTLQGDRGLALSSTMCGKAHDTALVFEVAITKTPLSPLQTVYNREMHLCLSLGA